MEVWCKEQAVHPFCSVVSPCYSSHSVSYLPYSLLVDEFDGFLAVWLWTHRINLQIFCVMGNPTTHLPLIIWWCNYNGVFPIPVFWYWSIPILRIFGVDTHQHHTTVGPLCVCGEDNWPKDSHLLVRKQKRKTFLPRRWRSTKIFIELCERSWVKQIPECFEQIDAPHVYSRMWAFRPRWKQQSWQTFQGNGDTHTIHTATKGGIRGTAKCRSFRAAPRWAAGHGTSWWWFHRVGESEPTIDKPDDTEIWIN